MPDLAFYLLVAPLLWHIAQDEDVARAWAAVPLAKATPLGKPPGTGDRRDESTHCRTRCALLMGGTRQTEGFKPYACYGICSDVHGSGNAMHDF